MHCNVLFQHSYSKNRYPAVLLKVFEFASVGWFLKFYFRCYICAHHMKNATIVFLIFFVLSCCFLGKKITPSSDHSLVSGYGAQSVSR